MKLPKMLDEWQENVSPVIMFQLHIAKKPTYHQKSQVILKMLALAFGAKNHQMSQL
jgi:hypothetical protein